MTASTTDRAGILDEILAHPADDLPRRAYADWLEEFGDADDLARAQFIRLQIEAAAFPEGSPDRTDRSTRARQFLNDHRQEWEQPLRDLGAMDIQWERGFPATISMQANMFLENGGQVFAAAPITGLFTRDLSSGQIATFAASPHLSNLTDLSLWGNGINDTGAATLAASPHLANLTALNLKSNEITAAGAQALAASPHLANLTALNLSNNNIGDAGAQALARSPHLANLTTLDLWWDSITDAGAQALARSPHLANLTILDLSWNVITDVGARALTASPHLANLTILDLEDNDLGDNLLNEINRTFARRSKQTIVTPP